MNTTSDSTLPSILAAQSASGLPSVCHFSTVHSGVEIRIVRKELASLAKAGYPAYLVIPGTERDVAEAREMGIRMIALSPPDEGHRLYRFTGLAWKAFNQVRATGASIVHFHDPELMPVGLALKALGRKVVMDSHEDLRKQILNKHWIRPGLRKGLASVARFAERFTARRIDGIVGAAPRHHQIYGGAAKRLAIVRNFPLDGELSSGDQSIPWSSRDRIAYVGLISRIRGLFEMVDALPEGGARLLLAGRFSSQAERDEIVQHPGWNLVDELGFVDRAGIRAAMNRAFAGICTLHAVPSHVDAEPIKLFEYMAAGIPVICATVPGWQQVVDDARCGICVDPHDSKAIAQAIRWLREHPAEAEQMGRNGQRAAQEKYTWSAQAAELIALYQAISPPRQAHAPAPASSLR